MRVLIDVFGVVTKGYGNCKCCMLRILVDFMMLPDIYYFYFELADDTYSVLVFVLTPTCILSLLFVECSKRTVVFNTTTTLASLHYTGFQGELMLLAWTGSSSSCLDALKFRHGLVFIYFSFLDTLRFSNLRIDVLVMMTSRFWG